MENSEGMNSDPIIKRIRTHDEIKEAANLAEEIWTEHYMPIIGSGQIAYMLDRFQSVNAISKSMEEGNVYCTVSIDGHPFGYFAIREEDGTFLSKFYVKKKYRGLGAGKTMFNWIIEFSKSRGLNRIWLTCNKYNEKSISIYKHLGFEIIDSVVTDIGSGYVMDDYVMEKKI